MPFGRAASLRYALTQLHHSPGRDLEKDESGFYQEFPAYVAESEGITYELLGHPEPEYDIRQFTKDEFELIISSSNTYGFKEKVDDLMKRLPVEGGVACRILD